MTRLQWAIVFCAMMLTMGCGGGATDSLPRVAISGSAARSGVAIKGGALHFIPLQQGAPSVSTMITDGKYAFSRQNGPVAGKYSVQVEVPGGSNAIPMAGGDDFKSRRFGKLAAPPQTKTGDEIDKLPSIDIE